MFEDIVPVLEFFIYIFQSDYFTLFSENDTLKFLDIFLECVSFEGPNVLLLGCVLIFALIHLGLVHKGTREHLTNCKWTQQCGGECWICS